MNISDRHDSRKAVSTQPIFKGEAGTVTALQILAGELLAEHITNIPAFLLCVRGEVVFENEQGVKSSLKSGDTIDIEPNIKHWVKGISDSQLVLIK